MSNTLDDMLKELESTNSLLISITKRLNTAIKFTPTSSVAVRDISILLMQLTSKISHLNSEKREVEFAAIISEAENLITKLEEVV